MRRLLCVLAVATMVVLVSGVPTAERRAETAPTFAKDVAPILFENCASCHRPGDIAPMSLLSYQDARPWAKAIKDKVVAREMPPWHAAPGYRELRNSRGLTREQIDIIASWVDAGAPLGDAKDLPPAPTFPEGWHHPSGRPPDYVLELPIEIEIPAEGEMPYLYVYTAIPFAEDVFAEAVEMLPDNRSVVHHMSANIVALPEGTRIVDGQAYGADGRLLTEEDIRAAVGETESNALGGSTKLICFVPGRGFEMFHAGVAKRVPARQFLRWNLHYNATGRPERDRSRIGIWKATAPVAYEMLSRTIGSPIPTTPRATVPVVVNGEEVARGQVPVIPPFADDWEVIMTTDVTEPITFYAISPHMHLRGKDMRFVLAWPDGRREILLDVPKYDFNWQTEFELVEPIKIPAGSRLVVEGHYDNSINNRYNPAPHKEVYWGEQSWDEMFEGWVKYSIDSQNLTSKPQTEN